MRFCAALAIAMLATFAFASAQDAGGNSPDARELYVGKWQGQGHLYDTPYSKEGDVTDTTVCSWASERTYLVCEQVTQTPGGPGHQLAVYVRTADGYAFQRIGTDGSANTSTIEVSGATWIYENSFDDKGRKITFRTTNDFSTPGEQRWKTVYSVNGASPIVIGEGVERRAQ